jgi:enamine deaminase RidA (YjgF/YER057c/UK114 family)
LRRPDGDRSVRTVGRIEDRLAELELTRPTPMPRFGSFEPVKLHGGLAYVAGHGPFDGATPLLQGVVGRDVTLEQAHEAARLTALAIVASLKDALGELDRVSQWLRVVGYVQTAPDFQQNAKVVNGFSDLIVELWGDAGRHARSAPGKVRRRSTSRSSSTRSSRSTPSASGQDEASIERDSARASRHQTSS